MSTCGRLMAKFVHVVTEMPHMSNMTNEYSMMITLVEKSQIRKTIDFTYIY